MESVGADDGLLSVVTDRRIVTVGVTTKPVVAAILALQVLLVGTVAIESLGVELPLLRGALAFVYLAFVPGFLLFRLIGARLEHWSSAIASVIGLSIASMMFLGVVVNVALRAIGVARPFTELPIVISISISVLALTAIYYSHVEEATTLRVDLHRLLSPWVLGLAVLPFLGIYGALVLTRIGNNLLLLGLYSVIALLPILALFDRFPTRLFPYAIWVIAISLLLQNTLTGQFLAWGDQPKEAALALSVLRTGYWDPALAPGLGNKFTMLRIVILHPIYVLFTDAKLVWVFKLAHPLLFSVTPVALYQAYRRYVPDRAAFLSAFLYVSLFSFFIVLSRNTRTATALLFLSLIAMLVADRSLPLFQRKILTILFAAGIVVSHYGVSYMVLFALAAVLPLTHVLDRITGRESESVTSWSFVLLYATMTFAWYIFASPRSKAFNLVIGFGETFITKLLNEFLLAPESTSATTRYVTSDFSSVTLDILRLYNMVVGALIGLGVLLTFWNLYRDETSVTFDNEYLAYATLFLGVFSITFLPVERFNTARTYATALLFFAPFFVVGVHEIFDLLSQLPLPDIRFPVRQLAAGAIVLYFVLNVGLVSATVTHEYSPNALVEKSRIMDDGHPTEKAYFYKQYHTIYSVESTSWMQAQAANDSTVFESGWPGGFKGAVGHSSIEPTETRHPVFRKRLIEQEMLSEGERLGPGYVYLNAYNWIGNVIRTPSGHFVYNYVYTRDVQSHWDEKNRIYDNGGSVVYR